MNKVQVMAFSVVICVERKTYSFYIIANCNLMNLFKLVSETERQLFLLYDIVLLFINSFVSVLVSI